MKFPYVVLVCICALLLGACNEKSEEKMVEELPASIVGKIQAAEAGGPEGPKMEKVLDGVLDNGSGTAFIFCRAGKSKNGNTLYGNEADFSRLAILLSRKASWHIKYSKKKIVSMAVFNEQTSSGDSTTSIPLGLLVEYETR